MNDKPKPKIQRVALEQLERMMEAGCQCPDCRSRPNTLYLTPRCHGGGVWVDIDEGPVMNITCGKCSLHVAQVGLSSAFAAQEDKVLRLHDGSDCPTPGDTPQHLDVFYTRGTGELTVACRACKKEMAKFTVALI